MYAVKQTGGLHNTLQVLGVVPADVADGEVWYKTLDRLLDGWAEADHGWRLSWIEDKLMGGLMIGRLMVVVAVVAGLLAGASPASASEGEPT
jgi:hypothetical protein